LHTVRSMRPVAQPAPGPSAPAGLSRARGHTPAAFCCNRGRSVQGPAFHGIFRVAEIALGHAQKPLFQWSLPLLSRAEIATIQGPEWLSLEPGSFRCQMETAGHLGEIGHPESEEKNNMCNVRIDPFGAH